MFSLCRLPGCLLAASVFAAAPAFAAGPAPAAPGPAWHDTAGNSIDAHGGCVLRQDGAYYWYGEVKTGRTFLPECNKSWGGTRVDMRGVSCYCSTNLSDWKDEGIVLAAVTNAAGDLNPGNVLERPKVIFNRTTRQFVMWMHIDSADYHEARIGVAVSDKPTGPFLYRGSFRPDAGVWPLNVTAADKVSAPTNYLARDFRRGQMSRDLTLFQDDDGEAYVIYSSEENSTLHVSQLTADYLGTDGKYSRILIGCNSEAPAVFKHGGKYYLIASGCTGWDPNRARSAEADSIFGPWRELGNPCTGPGADKTFQAQSAFVLPLPGNRDTFVFIADRWNKWDLAASRYLWLPLEFDGKDCPVIAWRDHWTASPSRPSELTFYSGPK